MPALGTRRAPKVAQRFLSLPNLSCLIFAKVAHQSCPDVSRLDFRKSHGNHQCCLINPIVAQGVLSYPNHRCLSFTKVAQTFRDSNIKKKLESPMFPKRNIVAQVFLNKNSTRKNFTADRAEPARSNHWSAVCRKKSRRIPE